jgi:uncharacterized protein
LALNKELLDILECPKCMGNLEYKETEQYLICHSCRLKYPVQDDIPVMLIEEAEQIGER